MKNAERQRKQANGLIVFILRIIKYLKKNSGHMGHNIQNWKKQ